MGRMREELQRMEGSGGKLFYLVPTFANPIMPIATIHTLNASPIYKLWYSFCNIFVFGLWTYLLPLVFIKTCLAVLSLSG